MSCKHERKYLDAYIDGELEPGLMLEIDRHLETCEGCQAVVLVKRKMKDEKTNIRRNNGNAIVLYDTDETITATIENFKDSPAKLTMLQHIPGQWDMEKCTLEYKRKAADTLEFEIELPAKGKKELVMQYHRRNVR